MAATEKQKRSLPAQTDVDELSGIYFHKIKV